ncbi:hypothetical protein [Gymnodinialimonas ulvae]|uniref:hypothetical protein n=1 Tax=Gymnodinialimonas ulvae TaxID=3126504 RepID=UPI003099B48C
MDALVKALGGSLIGLARKHVPDYSFAAYVHAGDRVDVYFFKGRALERKTALADGSKALEQFRELQAATVQKSGFFKKTPYRTARLAARARGNNVTLEADYEDAGAFTPTSDNARAAYGSVMHDAYPDVAKDMFTGEVSGDLDPTERTRRFMADHTQWNTYAMEEAAFEDSEARWNQGQSYDGLILRHCGPAKTYQGLAMASESPHDPAAETVTDERIEGDRAFVDTHFQNPRFDHLSHDYQYEFARDGAGAPWQLVELWYRDLDDKLLPSL